MKNIYLLFACLLGAFSLASAQNDLCSNATSLPCGTSSLAGSTVGHTNTASGTGCFIGNVGAWYTFVGDGQSTTISATTSSYDIEMAIASGSCGSLTNIACEDVALSSGTESYTFTPTNGVTYYVYIAHWSSGSSTSGTFTISRTCAGGGGGGGGTANDACTSAASLPCGTSSLAGTTVGATPSAPGIGCSMSDYGAWYTFPGDGLSTTITVSGGTLDAELAVASGSCGALTNIACLDGAGTGGTESITFTTTPGIDYYVYVSHWLSGSSTTGSFNISRTCGAAPTPPPNDNCADAIALTVNPDLTCSATTAGTITNATGSPDPTAETCFGTADDDVWFSFVATGTTHNISLINVVGTVSDMYHSVYEEGAGCPGLGAEILCSDADNSVATGLTPGNTYYVRVYTYTSIGAQTVDFDVCVTTPIPCAGGAGGQDCPDMQPICTDNTYCYTAGIGSTASSGNNYGCLSTQPNPSWYYFEISAAGNLIFDMSAGSDIDFAIWGPFANLAAANAACGSLSAPIDCSYSSSPTEQATLSGVSVGEIYVLVVTNYANVVQDINMTVSGTNTAATNCTIVNPTPCDADAGNW